MKEKRLHIRVSAEEKAVLTHAAQLQTQSLSQFVLAASLKEAEKGPTELTPIFIMPTEPYDAFAQRLDEAPHFLPNLAAQFAKMTPFRE